jgi:hypothetical protein
MTPKEKKAAYDRERRSRLKEEIAAQKRAYYLANKDAENARVKAWVEANRTRSSEIKRSWKARNPDADTTPRERTRRTEYMRQYRATHPEVHRRNLSLRRAKVSQATPAWADRQAIKAIYAAARSQGLEVDHRVPLRGKTVCGLHVEGNLKLLPATANRMKGNSYAD